jgi:7-keto-8-aminopelargonate synthetase-like enzyme
MKDEPDRPARVLRNAEIMRKGFRELGFNIGASVTPVVPIIIGDNNLTFLMWKTLFDEGVFVNPVISPAVQPGNQLLRTSYMATHTEDQLHEVLGIFEKVGKKLGVIH